MHIFYGDDLPLGIDSDNILDPEVDYTCVGLFRDEVLAAYNEDPNDAEPND